MNGLSVSLHRLLASECLGAKVTNGLLGGGEGGGGGGGGSGGNSCIHRTSR